MAKILLIVLGALVIALLLFQCDQLWKSNYEGWTKFSGPGFTVMVPPAPSGAAEAVTRVAGSGDTYHIRHGGELYQVSRLPAILPVAEHETEQVLDGWRDVYISSASGAQFIKQRQVNLSGYSGREVHLYIVPHKKHVIARCYIAASGSQLVCVSVDYGSNDAQLFVDSLTIEN